MKPQMCKVFKPPSRVLLATDLADLKRVLPVAVAYAGKFGAELKIAHVLPGGECPDIDPFLLVYADRAALERYASKRLAGAMETAAKAGVPCSTIIGSGRITEALRQVVEQWKPDRVIVGCGAKKFARHIMGSTAEAIMRALDVPVIAISPAAARRREMANQKPHMLFAADLNQESTETLRSVIECAQSRQADLMMLQIVQENGEQAAMGLSDRRFQEIVAGSGLEGFRSSSLIERGPVVETILRVARQEQTDLIALGDLKASTSGNGSSSNVAQEILCGAPCPVMTFKIGSQSETEELPAAS